MVNPFIADLHIHSRFSRATSRQLDLEHLWISAQRKGITVVGTGDFTHPGWFAELEQKLAPAPGEDGLFRLKPELERSLQEQVPPSCRGPVRFMLTVEISNIYKRDGATRKVHNLICAPDLEAAARFSAALDRLGNITSDGRPILGLDSRDLLEVALQADHRAVLIPAHIWTPWFSALGSRSGFDSITQCYADLAHHIFAVETGLSSDPPMNWRLSALDGYTLVSSSDAHSPGKLGREACLFSCGRSYLEMMAALRDPSAGGYQGTLEFFPEEGKYHLDGHRKCGLRLWPEQTRELDGVCPECGKPLVLGVMYRVEELADRPDGYRPGGASDYQSLLALDQVLGQVHGVGPATKTVAGHMEKLLNKLGPELTILRRVPLEELEQQGGALLAEAVRRMRAGEVHTAGGFDGEYGVVRLVEPQERRKLSGQQSLLPDADPEPPARKTVAAAAAATAAATAPATAAATAAAPAAAPATATATVAAVAAAAAAAAATAPATATAGAPASAPAAAAADPLFGLNPDQAAAASHVGSPAIIAAGPGTGKTRTLTRRIAHRIKSGAVPADQVLAVTFTTRAAAELAQRLEELISPTRGKEAAVRACTFHALALALLNEARARRGDPMVRILPEEERLELVAALLPAPASRRDVIRAGRELSLASLRDEPHHLLAAYREALGQADAMDLDELVPAAVALLQRDREALARWRRRYTCVCVDEYQDVNAAQAALVRLLCPDSGGTDLCVIGDPDQSIYRFRGSEPRFFTAFTEQYAGATQFHLERSYRTPTAILQAAQGLIEHCPERQPARTWSSIDGPPRVTVCAAPTAAAEAEQVVHWVERLVGGTSFFSQDSGRLDAAEQLGVPEEQISFGDIAVLYRVGSQAELLLEAFQRSAIPHTCPVVQSAPLAPVLEHMAREQISAELDAQDPRQALAALVDELCPEPARPAAHAQAAHLCVLLRSTGEGTSWVSTTLALAPSLTEADTLDPRAEAVSLLSLHAAKGLEFPVIFIVGCEDGLLPHRFGDEELQPEAEAEERRLLYVGMTRARRLLMLTHAGRRRVQGRTRLRRPSPFLNEIPAELLNQIRPAPMPQGSRKRQLKLF